MTPRAAGDSTVNPFEAIAARMESLSAPMSDNDGVRSFNDLYLAVTRAVGLEFANDRFEDPAFFSRLAPIFSNLYFDAVEADVAKCKVSRVWAPLFERRFETGIAPLQFAIAGMNAHINHDLAIALVGVTRELDYDLDLGSPHHRDHLRVNTTLALVMSEVKERFETGVVRTVIKASGTRAYLRSIERARDNAWTQAQKLVALDAGPCMEEQYLLARARTVSFTNRTLLVRTRRSGVDRRPGSRPRDCGPGASRHLSRPAGSWRLLP
jgi:hypothetical protein